MDKTQWLHFKTRMNRKEKSPIFNFHIDFNYELMGRKETDPILIPLIYNKKDSFGSTILNNFVRLNEYAVVSASTIEKSLVFVLLRTLYKEKTTVQFGRYIFDFSVLPAHLLRTILDYILNNELKRINLSWLEPIQTLLLEKEVEEKKQLKKRIKLNHKYEDPEPADYYAPDLGEGDEGSEDTEIYTEEHLEQELAKASIEEKSQKAIPYHYAYPESGISVKPVYPRKSRVTQQVISDIGHAENGIYLGQGSTATWAGPSTHPQLNHIEHEWKSSSETAPESQSISTKSQSESPNLNEDEYHKNILEFQKKILYGAMGPRIIAPRRKVDPMDWDLDQTLF